MNETGKVEVVRLLLAAAAVGDQERTTSFRTNEVEKEETRNSYQPGVLKMPLEPEPLDCRNGDGMVDEEHRRPKGRLGEQHDGVTEQPSVVEELKSMERDDS